MLQISVISLWDVSLSGYTVVRKVINSYNTYATNRVLIKIVMGVTMLTMIAVYRYSGI